MAETNNQYNSAEIEVLTGLDPVKKRPGMYTETSRPNHLVQEALDNAVDEALAGHASEIALEYCEDGAIMVSDNGRGMPIDIHPEHGISGVELIMTKLHSGAKFSDKSYKFSGGLHGVGISVANALSTRLEVRIRRDGIESMIAFENGFVAECLHVLGTVAKKNTGTSIKFWPNEIYFDTVVLAMSSLTHLIKAKAILCPGLKITLDDQKNNEVYTWQYSSGLSSYLLENMTDASILPEPFIISHAENDMCADVVFPCCCCCVYHMS